MDLNRVSRRDLYASDNEEEDQEAVSLVPAYVPDLVFEDVVVESDNEEEEREKSDSCTAEDEEMKNPDDDEEQKDKNEEQDEDEGFEFRLFSGPSKTTPQTTKIVIQEDNTASAQNAEEAIEGVMYVEMKRPDSYYFAKYSEADKSRFAESAVDGYNIVNQKLLEQYTPSPRFLGPNQRGPKVIEFSVLQAEAKREHQRMRNRRRPGKKARAIRKERYATQQEQKKQLQRQRQKESRKQYGFNKSAPQRRGVTKK